MAQWGPTREQRRILQEQAQFVGREAHGAPFRQLFNFEYADDAKMLTWGGLVMSKSLVRPVEACRFEDLAFVRSAADAFEISMPFITAREAAFLEEGLVGASSLPKSKGVAVRDISAFRDAYR